ncbi:MAG TPA: Uma2 family endonuclease [Blastocatellia bacterium]|nr:Uma2 family endonuclease [Blastocatellia bacterium]
MSVLKTAPIPEIYYPESDGKPMAETDTHVKLMAHLREALDLYYQDDPNVYVSANILLYYVQGNPKKRVSPDVFVAKGRPKGNRRVYKLWEEGVPPTVIIELGSKETWREDQYEKWRLYEQLGVQEYYLFDPEYSYLVEPLIGWHLMDDGQYRLLKVKKGRIKSDALGLELVDTGQTLRLYNPETKQFLPTMAELDAAREQAEARVRAEAEARQKAEAEIARLQAELAKLRQA